MRVALKTRIPIGLTRGERKAAFLAGALVVWLRVVAEFWSATEGSVALSWGLIGLPTLAVVVRISQLSPPITALFVVFAQLYYAPYPFPGGPIAESIPFASLVTALALAILGFRQARCRFQTVDHGVLAGVGATMVAVIAIGIAGAMSTGSLRDPATRQYVIDFVRTWFGYAALAFLGCQSLRDARLFITGIPVAFLCYPLYIPSSGWGEVVASGFAGSGDVLNVGLAYGTLNSNTLGHAAAVASIVAGTLVVMPEAAYRRSVSVPLALLGVLVGFLTGSRQFLLSVFVGLVLAVAFIRGRRAVAGIIGGALLSAVVLLVGVRALPEGAGLRLRLAELTMPSSEWESQSASYRLDDFQNAIADWEGSSVLWGGGFRDRRSHNLFLGLLAEVGVVGLFLFAMLWLWTIRAFSRAFGGRESAVHGKLLRPVIYSILAAAFVQQSISGGGAGGLWSNLAFGLAVSVAARRGIRRTESNVLATSAIPGETAISGVG